MALTMLDGSIDKKPENVADLFSSVGETVAASLEEKSISLICKCEVDTLYMDMDLMRSALVNLIENAKRAGNDGSVIELSAYDNVIEVKDYGCGISKEEISRITEPFYMIDRSRSKKNGGVGLGLSLVARIVKAHGWAMDIISAIGEGATVKLISCDVDK